MKKYLYSLICFWILFSCSSDTPSAENGNDNNGDNKQPQIELNTTLSNFTTDGGSNLIKFTAPEAWTAQVVNGRSESWCTIEPTSGPAGNASVTVTTKPNDTPDDRTASIVIKSGNTSKTISVSQKQKNALTLTSSKFELTSKGGDVIIEVKANIDFKYTIDEAAKNWITYTETRALKTSSLVFQISENEGVEKRIGKIYIKGSDFNETVNVYQEGIAPSIVLSQNEYVVSSDGETIAVDVVSNVNVEVEIPSAVDWISENTTRSTSTNTYRFDISPSDEYEERSAEIKFFNSESNLSEVVKVIQTQKDAIVIAKENYNVEGKGGQLQMEVGHNVDFDVIIDVDWITESTSRAYTTSTLIYDIAENSTYDNRSGTILFSSKDGLIKQIVTINQASKDALIVSKKDIVVSKENGVVSFDIQTNVEFTVSNPDVDWLRPITSRGLTNHTLHYEYDANNSYEPRTAKIVVTDVKNNKSETITVTQSQKDAIVIAKESYDVEGNGSLLQMEIGHNVDFDVSIDVDWITQSSSRAYTASTLIFEVAENEIYEKRTGSIRFTSKDGLIKQTVTVYQASKDALIISENDITVGAESGVVSFIIQSNVEFTVSDPNVDWLRPITSRGLTDHTLRYTYDANTSYESRTAQIVITDIKNNRSETISITQSQKDAIVISKDNYALNSEGGQLQLEIGHNIDFDVFIDVDWITQVTSRAYTTSLLTFDVAENPNYDNRSGIIRFTSKDGSIVQTVKVYQVSEDALIVSKNDIALGAESGTFSFDIQTNVEFAVSAPNVDWLRSISSRGLTEHTLHYEYDANTTYESRTTQIVVTDTKNNRSETITITQSQKDAIVITKDYYTFESVGGQLQLEVGHNIDFNVSIDVDWITESASRAYTASTLVFNVAENSTYDSRSGTIRFTSKDGSIKQTVTVYQAFKDALIVSDKNIAVDSRSGTLSFDIQTNVEFTVSAPNVDWLRSISSRGLTEHTLHYEYDANTTYESRTAQIVVTDTKNNYSETITITQSQKDVIVIGKETYTVASEGGQLQLEIGHNIDFKVLIDVDWITQSSSRAYTTSTVVFNVAENPTYDNRSGVIQFSSQDGSIKQTVIVNQICKEALIVSKKEMTVGAGSGVVSFDVQANVEFTVSSPDVDWLRPITSRGLNNHTLRYEYDANTSHEPRTAQIVVSDINNNYSETITITQAQKDVISISKDQYKFESEGGQLQLEVGHNIDFDISIDVDWISQVATRAYSTSNLVFDVAANETYDNRSGTITISSLDGSITHTVTVQQTYKEALIISKKDIAVGAESGSVSFSIQSNVDYTVSAPNVSWLRSATSRALTEHTYSYGYDANTSYEPRTAQIVVTDTKNNKSETITITQAQKNVIVIAKDKYTVDGEGGQIKIEVQHNVEFNVSMDVDWITQSSSRVFATSTLVFNVTKNPESNKREGTITFTSKDGSIKQTVKVIQLKEGSFNASIGGWGKDENDYGGSAK